MFRTECEAISINSGPRCPFGPENGVPSRRSFLALLATESQSRYLQGQMFAAFDPTRPLRPAPLDRSGWRFAFEVVKTLVWLTVVGTAAFIAIG